MPNYKLSSGIKGEIGREAYNLMKRRYDHMRSDFPLTADRLQELMMPKDLLVHVHALQQGGFDVGGVHTVFVALHRDHVPGLMRAAAIECHSPVPIHEMGNTRWYGGSSYPDPGSRSSSVCVLNDLTPDEQTALASWTNNVVREKRLSEIAEWTVKYATHRFVTTCELLATWPMLATLVTDAEWRKRFRSPVRNISQYRRPAGMDPKFIKAMPGVEQCLLAAQMLPETMSDDKQVRATVKAWEHLARDEKWG